MKIEVNVPEGLDLDHTYQAVMDAMYNADNVSKQEVLLVSSMLNQLASKKPSMQKGFREWVETHHEIVCTIHAMIDNKTVPKKLSDIIDMVDFAGLYDLGIELTTDFCNTYRDREWDGDWIETIIEFVNAKLK